MKLNAREARGYFQTPDLSRAGVLIYGPDAMRVALRRQELIAAIIGENGEEEMRLTRIASPDLRKDPALLLDAIKSQGFFPGNRVAFVEDATDQASAAIVAALEDWAAGDATMVVTAGQLAPRSSLRKLFEIHSNVYAAAIYADPPSRDEIEAELSRAGISEISPDAMRELVDLGGSLEPGDFRQTLEKLSLYKYAETSPVSSEDVANCAPVTTDAGLDEAIAIVAEGRFRDIGPIVSKLEAQGVAAVRLCIAMTQHFRRLHAAISDPKGPEAGLSRARPPVPYMRKGAMARQATSWGGRNLENALQLLIETDLQLRSSTPLPQMAMMQRAMIRLAMMLRR